MNYKSVRNVIGRILTLESILLIIPLIVCLIYQEPTINLISFAGTSLGIFIFAQFWRIGAYKSYQFRAKEGLVVVGLSWLLLSAFGALPFVISGQIPSYIDAFFETASGFTTTGASILTNVEAMDKSFLFYRSLTQWIGGMGVLVFILTITSEKNDNNSIHLLRAETTGPSIGKLSSKMKFTTRILYIIYIGLTLLETILLLIGGNDLFTSICLSLTTMATGGYSILNSGIASYNIYSQYVIIVFMLFAGINFTLYYYLFIKKFKKFFKNEELITYLLIVISSTAIIAINIFNKVKEIEPSIRQALFTVVSVITTTGFAISDYSLYPALSLTIILIIMIIGSCAGSTAGGLKISRLIILAKTSVKRIKNKINEDRVEVIKIDDSPISDSIINETKTFFVIYIAILLIGTLLVSIDGVYNDFTTNFTASLTCISNVGPGLGNVGPASNFAAYSGFSKIVLSIEMLIGRLELFPILVLFNPTSWRKY